MTKEPGQTSAASVGANAFIARWSAASASERAHSEIFLAELCGVLGVPRPGPRHKPETVVEILESLVTLGRACERGPQFAR